MTMTVTGPAHELGIVAVREHVLYGLPGWQNDPWSAIDRPGTFDAVIASLREFKDAGGGTLVDAGSTLSGRDPEMLANLARASGVRIVASTGFGAQHTVPGYFLAPLAEKAMRSRPSPGGRETLWVPDAGYLAGLMLAELTEGLAGAGMNRTNVKAGLVVASSSPDRITEFEELSIRAAAIAARDAGVPVLASGACQAQRQFELMSAEGLSPGRMIIGHCDDARAVNLKRDRQLADKGAYVAYDHVGWEDGAAHCMPDEQRIGLVKEMAAAGFANRVLLSCSAVACGLGMPRSKHRFGYLLKEFVPRLKEAGVAEEAIHTMLVENPARILAGSQSQGT